ncbi:hypothetical protein RHECNPAF_25300111 [Rhizobium etli CNPAF512]|nr:hypothetical protein RHECNPAF_25300111 [Rhizobium etli CNPAF512]
MSFEYVSQNCAVAPGHIKKQRIEARPPEPRLMRRALGIRHRQYTARECEAASANPEVLTSLHRERLSDTS